MGLGMAATRSKNRRTSVVLPTEALQRVNVIATANGVSAAWVIRTAVIRFLEQQGGQIDLPLIIPGRSSEAG